jgi:anti-anti-sigma factor
MSEHACPVRWAGSRAEVTLPEHITRSNADRIGEQLSWIINRGAAVVVADLTQTVSCHYSGADALVRAHHRALANGTELRLVVVADMVRRVLSLNGLDRLVCIYPTLEGAIAGDDRPDMPGPADADPTDELLDWVVGSIFNVGISLQAVLDLPRDIGEQRITESMRRLDDAIRAIRDYVFARSGQEARPGVALRPLLEARERSALARNRLALLRQRVAQTAYALHSAATDTAALLERQADLVGVPGRIDYPAEIKRWQVFADQTRQMAEHWDQLP